VRNSVTIVVPDSAAKVRLYVPEEFSGDAACVFQ
jgi:hypothetical protein